VGRRRGLGVWVDAVTKWLGGTGAGSASRSESTTDRAYGGWVSDLEAGSTCTTDPCGVKNNPFIQTPPLHLGASTCVQTWVGTPAIYVFDCSAAGQILYSFRVSAAHLPCQRSLYCCHAWTAQPAGEARRGGAGRERHQACPAQASWTTACLLAQMAPHGTLFSPWHSPPYPTFPRACLLPACAPFHLQQFMLQRQQEMEGGYLQHQQAAAAAAGVGMMPGGAGGYGERAGQGGGGAVG